MPRRNSILHASLVLLFLILPACSTRDEGDNAESPPARVAAGQSQHIVDLVEQKLITVRITGISMDAVALKIRNTSSQAVQAEIPAGTYFVAENPLVQNMVARHSTVIQLGPLELRDARVDAACASVRRAEPGPQDTFGIVRASQQPELGKVIDALNAAGVDYPVEQAAVWIVTDDATYDDLGMLVGGSRYGSALIGPNEAVQAMRIVAASGLDIFKYAIWRDQGTLHEDLTQPELAEWLEGQSVLAASTRAAAPTATLTPAPTARTVGEQRAVDEWAALAEADRELSSEAGSAMQAVGPPDTLTCGEYPTAWQSGGSNPGAVLTVHFDQPLIPEQIVIYESFNPGTIYYVEAVGDQSGAPYQVYGGDAALLTECPHVLVIDVTTVNEPIRSINISVDQSNGWTAIDAVGLSGKAP
jgi:hypothetical protein